MSERGVREKPLDENNYVGDRKITSTTQKRLKYRILTVRDAVSLLFIVSPSYRNLHHYVSSSKKQL